MEAIKKQASKLREQVARQQQAILRQLGQLGHGGVMIDEADMQLHEQLQNLYKSTRAAKHFQRDIVRGLEAFISTSKKQMEIARKLAEDCCKYGIENQDSASSLARVASDFGTSHASIEDQREAMLGILGHQVSEPLRAMINGAPLEDARHLTQRYDRMRQEFEVQAAEVIRRQSKSRDTSAESALKLKSAEKKLTDLKSSMLALGREATSAMVSVEDQQQETTFQKLLTIVDAERSYHQNVVAILEKLHSEMIVEEQMEDSSLQSEIPPRDESIQSPNNEIVSNRSNGQNDEDKSDNYFIAKVIHSFDAQADGELSLELDDYVVVRQVSSNGWSEGECKGKAGWFPSAYVERRDKVPKTKLSGDDSSP
ncbi:Lysophosphatidic acid acyltransferase endophilin/SH3GL, involved in synaptic vesicle formation [Handroanthus impetiginosus]|uniref:Lysophosphatidic acid acyltransferase endophilin/SH3GL, involved in synaptic vesicle formation n=1 Tax=Handroanthus impetiginosus TaxID=429701 RepID=A0A2G9H7Y0_9LAMI|nr:Lysophosphatidic acid acyltransferase endophilin/SH3GL, involved in synaptic vesicle formation [Handroanthus impetiginosus]